MTLHRAQLHVCHQKIDAKHIDRRAGSGQQRGFVLANQRFCDLSAYAWCYTCDMYICDIHLNSRHNGRHQTVIEFPHNTTRPGRRLMPDAED